MTSPSRRWNGYGLSFFRCRCGSARRAEEFVVKDDCLQEVNGPPCKRCGDKGPIPHWPVDPWLYIRGDSDV
jgi:hypothetical protein